MEIEEYIVATDQHLVELVLDGDHTAFEYLFTRYRESIYLLMLARLGSAQDADDVIQETFIKVFINIHRYDSRYTFGQWIYTIARNTFIDFKRKRHEDISLDNRFTLTEECNPTPEQSVINSQVRSQIDNSIRRLNPMQQQLFKMRFLDEYSYEEIAEKLQIPMGTVKTNIHRARAKMCRYITEGDK